MEFLYILGRLKNLPLKNFTEEEFLILHLLLGFSLFQRAQFLKQVGKFYNFP